MTTTSPQRIKICYRAEFLQPGKVLNPSGFKLRTPIGVEVRKSAGWWKAFRPGTDYQFIEITAQAEAGTLMGQVPLFFKAQLTDWQMYEITEPSGAVKPIAEDEIYRDKKGKVYRK